jgi:hypothetical protein
MFLRPLGPEKVGLAAPMHVELALGALSLTAKATLVWRDWLQAEMSCKSGPRAPAQAKR